MKKPLDLSLTIGTDPVPVPAPPAEQPARPGPGRPPKPPRENARRIAVTVDGDLYRRIRIACAELDIDRQTFLERAIARMLTDEQTPE